MDTHFYFTIIFLPDSKILALSKWKAFSDNNSTHSHTMTPFDAPGKQAFENTVVKGQIARNEQFPLFPLCFSIH